MKPASKNFAASAAALFTFALFVMTAPTARADDYCITNGAQVANGCGYPTMEACQARSSGIGECARSNRHPKIRAMPWLINRSSRMQEASFVLVISPSGIKG